MDELIAFMNESCDPVAIAGGKGAALIGTASEDYAEPQPLCGEEKGLGLVEEFSSSMPCDEV